MQKMTFNLTTTPYFGELWTSQNHQNATVYLTTSVFKPWLHLLETLNALHFPSDCAGSHETGVVGFAYGTFPVIFPYS